MEDLICSFFGHRAVEITKDLYAATAIEIKKAMDFGCRTFYFGGYGDFDDLCYRIVSKLAEENPELHIKRVYCVAREEYLRKRVRYFCPEDYDGVIYLQPSFDGWYKSIYFRNCAMIDASNYVIFYAEARESSGAYKAFRYAKRRKDVFVVNLFNG